MSAQKAPAPAETKAASPAQAPWRALGTRPEDVCITSSHLDPSSSLELVYVEQLYRAIPLYTKDLTLAYAKGQLMHRAAMQAAVRVVRD